MNVESAIKVLYYVLAIGALTRCRVVALVLGRIVVNALVEYRITYVGQG